ncbi:calcineurin-like phosphoesterase [Stagonosporopsis vannaccii]|nr:calcineurin-like phosphoesterase [Stagonosporopsis vannaccii]
MATHAVRKRKTRIVCISDTHNNTPKLPPGDVLIHAGDLTNQGSYDELERTVAWLEKAPSEVKIVVAGNHEITLDEQFYEEKGSRWKWPAWQSPRGCLKLLRESKTITYLENQSTMVYLKRPSGPQTCFKVFGSPSTPGLGNWAFEYGAEDAMRLWSAIPKDADIVVTHTPPKGLRDGATKDDRSGCPALLQRLAIVRPSLHVCGHIHEARGIERVHWSSSQSDSLVASVEHWLDPGRGNKKLSLLDLTSKAGRPLGSSVLDTRQIQSHLLQGSDEEQPECSMSGAWVSQPDQVNLKSTTSLIRGVLQESEAYGRVKDSGVVEHRRGDDTPRAALQGDSGRQSRWSRYEETAVINAAFLGPRINGKTTGTNKAIVVDMDLPVWKGNDGDDVQ